MSSETENNRKNILEALPEDSIKYRQNAANTSELRCPLCGSFAGQKWWIIFLINFVLFLLFAFMSFIFLQFGSLVKLILFLICTGITIISLFALPITLAMAIAARPRCRLCGHRFWPASGISNSADNERFPARNAVIGSAILLISFGIVVALVTSIPGREMLGVTLIIAGWIIMAGPVLGTGLIAQAVLWRTIRTRINNSTRMGTFLLLPVIVIVAGFLALTMYYRSVCVRKYNPQVRAPKTLAWCNLAPLPDSAHDVHIHTLRFLFVGKDYLRFNAEPEEIEWFLADSPGLDGITCHTYSKEKMRLATSDIRLTFSFVKKDDEHEYFYPVSRTPAWYNEEIRGKGRYFDLSEGQTSWIGELIVDDEKHIVYIHKSK